MRLQSCSPPTPPFAESTHSDLATYTIGSEEQRRDSMSVRLGYIVQRISILRRLTLEDRVFCPSIVPLFIIDVLHLGSNDLFWGAGPLAGHGL